MAEYLILMMIGIVLEYLILNKPKPKLCSEVIFL